MDAPAPSPLGERIRRAGLFVSLLVFAVLFLGGLIAYAMGNERSSGLKHANRAFRSGAPSAVEELRRAYILTPDDPSVQSMLLQALMDSGDHEGARALQAELGR